MCDSRWEGVVAVGNDGSDTVYGLSSNGSLYALRNAQRLVQMGKKRDKPYEGCPKTEGECDSKRFKEKL